MLAKSYAEGADLLGDPEQALDLTAPGYVTARGKRFHGSILLSDLQPRPVFLALTNTA
jgi:hypothetical protein